MILNAGLNLFKSQFTGSVKIAKSEITVTLRGGGSEVEGKEGCLQLSLFLATSFSCQTPIFIRHTGNSYYYDSVLCNDLGTTRLGIKTN